MADKKIDKIVLEREYIIPIRPKLTHTQEFRKVPRAVKIIKQFIVRHMRVEDRDVEKVKINKWLNNELWFRGIRKPASKIKVKAKKLESGEVIVELAEIPEVLKWKIEKENKLTEKGKKKVEEKKAEKEKVEEKEKPEDKKEEKEKEEAIIEEGLKGTKAQHKEVSHESQHGKFKKQTTPKRMALEK